MIEVVAKRRSQDPPPWGVWQALVEPHKHDRRRPWLVLQPEEVEPEILEAR